MEALRASNRDFGLTLSVIGLFGSVAPFLWDFREETAMAHRVSHRIRLAVVGMGLFVLAIASSAGVGAASPTYINAYTAHGCAVGDNFCLSSVTAYGYGYAGYGYAYPAGFAYRDNRYCDDGNVISTPTGYFCANGTPLHLSGSNVPVGGYTVVAPRVVTAPVFVQPRTSIYSEVK
jgi:hypothetical protein